MAKTNLTVDEKIAKFQEQLLKLEQKKKELIKKKEENVKSALFNAIVTASKKNTTILDLILENIEEEEQGKIRGFFKQVYKVKFTTPEKSQEKQIAES